jgi:hypothetical protein
MRFFILLNVFFIADPVFCNIVIGEDIGDEGDVGDDVLLLLRLLLFDI